MPKPNGYILYEGPSALDGAPIVVIATGFATKSRNGKTGGLIATWILRSDISPTEAVKSGEDISICGDCVLRRDPVDAKRRCYVRFEQAPLVIWKAYKRGIYPRANKGQAQELVAGRIVRFGSYGDPAAAPLEVWRTLASTAKGWTGYSHQWRKLGPDWQRLVMASADSEADARQAWSQGWRTFRVTVDPLQHIKGLESSCPASKEKGAVTDCATCRACMGTASKARASITIARH